MTITNETARVSYTASGLSTFTYPFRILDEDDLLVVLRDTNDVETIQVLNVDYTVTGVGNEAGGTVVFTSAPTASDVVTIILDPPRTQTLDLTAGSLSLTVLEDALDKLVNIVKRVYDRVSTALTRTDGGGGFDAGGYRITSVADPTADQDAATKAYVASAIATAEIGGNSTVSAFGATLIDDANATVARATLGAGTKGDEIFKASTTGAIWGQLDVNSAIYVVLENASTVAEWRTQMLIPDQIPYPSLGVLNGDFKVWQTGTSRTNATTVLNSDDTYFADQWILLSDGNNRVNISNNATTFGYPDGCLGLAEFELVTTNKWGILQPIESIATVPLRGKTLTVSFFSNSDSTLRDFRCHLVSWSTAFTADVITSDIISAWNGSTTKPTAISNVTLLDNISAGSTFTCAVGSWTQHVFRFTVPADAINLGIFVCTNDASTAPGDKVAFTGFQATLASVATPFRSRPFLEELILCQRYYLKTFPYATAPVQNSGSLTGAVHARLNYQGTGNPRCSAWWSFPVTMRGTPSVLTYNPTAAADTWDEVGGAGTLSVTVDGAGERGVLIYSAAAGSAGATGTYAVHATADARL